MTFMLSELVLSATDVKQIATRVRFVHAATVGEDELNEARFIEASYWAAAVFNVKQLPKIVVVHVDSAAGEFLCPNAQLHGCVDYGTDTAKEAVYVLWLRGEITDGLIMSGLTNVLQKETGLSNEEAIACGQRALKSLSATIPAQTLKRK